MSNLLHLAYVINKGNGFANFASDVGRRRNKLNKAGSLILFGVLIVYMGGLMTISALGLYDLLAPVGLAGLLVSLCLSAGVLLVFLFGILYVISIFYYASDVEKLLPLPLRADDIIGAKLLVTAAYEYLYLAVLVVPPLAVYGIRSGAGALYYVYAVLSLVFLPIIPLCLSSILVMLVMRFTPLARNKDRFNMVSGLLVMVVALGFVFGIQSLATFSEQDLASLLGNSAGQIAGITASVFPGTSFAASALAEPAGWLAAGQIGLVIVIALAALAVTMQLSRILYFKGVIGLGASSSSRRRLTAKEMADAGTSGSAFWTYVLKDVRVLLRTPIFFMNNVLMNFLWPVFILIPLLTNQENDSLGQVFQMLRQTVFTDGSSAALALAITFGVGCFISGTNGIAESALSREGKLMYIMKILPMSYTRQLWAKLTVGVLMSLCGTLIMAVLFIAFLQPPLWFALLLLAVLPGAILLPNVAGIIFELFWPKLNWDNEQKAVKQNLNVLYGILLAMLLAAVVIAPIAALHLGIVPAAGLIIFVPLLLTFALAVLLRRIGPRQIRSMDV